MSRVLVTGGGSGTGRAVARDFTAQGFEMECKSVDVTDEEAVRDLFAEPFEIVVANAGAGTAMRVADMPLEMWENTVSVNLTGVFLTFREALQGMD